MHMNGDLKEYFAAEISGARVVSFSAVSFSGGRNIVARRPDVETDYKIFEADAVDVTRAAERYFSMHGYTVLSRLDDSAFGMEKDDTMLSIVASRMAASRMGHSEFVLFSIRAF